MLFQAGLPHYMASFILLSWQRSVKQRVANTSVRASSENTDESVRHNLNPKIAPDQILIVLGLITLELARCWEPSDCVWCDGDWAILHRFCTAHWAACQSCWGWCCGRRSPNVQLTLISIQRYLERDTCPDALNFLIASTIEKADQTCFCGLANEEMQVGEEVDHRLRFFCFTGINQRLSHLDSYILVWADYSRKH